MNISTYPMKMLWKNVAVSLSISLQSRHNEC